MSISPRLDANQVAQADAIAGTEPSDDRLVEPEEHTVPNGEREMTRSPAIKSILIGGRDGSGGIAGGCKGLISTAQACLCLIWLRAIWSGASIDNSLASDWKDRDGR
jgi:hypothetical protein